MSQQGITEGVAYTFVTPEEGSELTRIEMRINRVLKRDEIKDYDAVVKPVQTSIITPMALTGPRDGVPGATAEAPAKEAPKPAPPLIGRGGRPPRRIRRAL